jgi:hypothetical protein
MLPSHGARYLAEISSSLQKLQTANQAVANEKEYEGNIRMRRFR